jgi:hypothetical protein
LAVANTLGSGFAEQVYENALAAAELVEFKAVKALDDIHRAQCPNNLKATGLRLCLLLSFGPSGLEFKRILLGL